MIILTGGAGFVGSNLLKGLNRMGRSDIMVVDNLRNSRKFRNLVGAQFSDYMSKQEFYSRLQRGDWDKENIDAVLHQGACTDTLEYDGEYMMRMNYKASISMLHFALRKGARFIYASSASVYGHSSSTLESVENESPLNVYAFSKMAFDHYARRVCRGSKSTVVGLRYFNVYGPGEAHKGRMASMIYQFTQQIQETGAASLFGEKGRFGAGEQTRDFVYVDDVVGMNLHFMTRDPVTAIVNAGSGVRSSWNRVASCVIDSLGFGKIQYIPFPEELTEKYQFDTVANLDGLRSLGFTQATTPLEVGIERYVRELHAESTTERIRVHA